jgi:uncharacterized phage protein (TIGR02218 family)
MPRTCSPALLAHMSSSATTLCFLQKVGPLPDDSYICTTSNSRDMRYDDGTGERIYYARTGVQLSNMASANDLSVDNGEAQTLVEIPTYPNTGITEEMIEAGRLDGVEFVIYKVNYRDLSMGHMIESSGPVGEIRRSIDGLITIELRSWCDLLRQNSVTERDSLTCRVKRFGSQPGDERFPCMYDLTGEWITSVTVTDVGAETVRDFEASSLGQAANYFSPGLIEWTSGDNQGKFSEVQTFTAGGGISLLFTTKFPIQNGDTFSIRRDCSRKWAGNNSCDTFGNREWFRGEPFIPVSDRIALTVPGAAAGGLFQ